MSRRGFRLTRRRSVLAVTGAAVALAVAACSGGDTGSGDDDVQSLDPDEVSGEITVWSWSTNASDLADLFMEEYPNIEVEMVDPGGGTTTMERLLTAFQSGSGAPDVAMMEYNFIPQFALTGDIIPIDDLGGAEIIDDYIDSIANQLTVNDQVYGTPIDASPMAFLYRADILEEAGVEPPTTWDEFADAAARLQEHDAGTYLANNPIADGSLRNLLWQTGQSPIAIDGENITIDYDRPEYQQVLGYWQRLAEEGVTGDFPSGSPEWNAAMADGTLAGWIGPAWAPVILGSAAESSAGEWRVAQMPTWEEGERASAEWGGSAYTVTSQSDNPEAAAAYVTWVNHAPEAYELLYELTGSFPVLTEYVEDPDFVAEPFEFFGGQPVNQVFAEELQAVPGNWQWSPFNSMVNQVTDEAFTALREGEMTPDEATSLIQEELVAYAAEQGFSVNE
ncbi:ABC transporter substrate-binding protein [Georgenia alba]|uniref:ABC transporter substrate-binding protein n=1 Tax=Georgenia alba TaxID=2233858 RepID=A0ABW2QBL7_9MICO